MFVTVLFFSVLKAFTPVMVMAVGVLFQVEASEPRGTFDGREGGKEEGREGGREEIGRLFVFAAINSNAHAVPLPSLPPSLLSFPF